MYFELKSDGKICQRCHSQKCEGKSFELPDLLHGLPEKLFVDPNAKNKAKSVANIKVSVKTSKDVASMASLLIAKMEEQRFW